MKKQNKNRKSSSVLKTVFYGLVPVLFFFLILNIRSSQKAPDMYFRFIEEKSETGALYLQYIKKHPSFLRELAVQKSIYGKEIEETVFRKDRERKKNIIKLEGVLQKNPEARDVLYHLSLLYSEEGSLSRANAYLNKAKNLDPLISDH